MPWSAHRLLKNPVNSDTLSDVLQGVRLTGAVFFDIRASGPWAEAAAAGPLVAPRLLPGVQHLISYHVVTEGRCWAGAEGEPWRQLCAGDIIVFPHGDPHIVSSEPGMKVKPDLAAYDAVAKATLPISHRIGTDETNVTRIVCGFLGCDVKPFNPLISTLPRVLHISDRAGATRGWLNQFVNVALAEFQDRRPGGHSILARLSELMFVETVRRYLETLPPGENSWLAGIRDGAIGRALAALHRDPRRAWTLEELAAEAGLSRSVFADRFALLVGRPPMQYLACWRMQLAAAMLSRGAKVTSVAYDVGYESEAAFSRAFKKLTGHSPGGWRSRNDRAFAPPVEFSPDGEAVSVAR